MQNKLKEVLIQLRVVNYEGEEQTADPISLGRLDATTFYFEIFLESPISGYGFGEKLEIDFRFDPNIVWLKNIIISGITSV